MAGLPGPEGEAVIVGRGAIVEAVALLLAGGALWATLAGGDDTPIEGRFLVAGAALYEAGFGEQLPAAPALVEAEARSHEILAEILELVAADAGAHRATARRMREAATTDVPFGGEAVGSVSR